MASGAEVDTKELDRELKKIGQRVTDYSPITPVLAEILVAWVNDSWESAGFGTWAPLHPSTIRRRRQKGLGAQILKDTGRRRQKGLGAQILKDTGRSAASVQAASGPDWAQAATDVSYMAFHASDAPRTVIPLRNPFDVEEQAWPDLAEALGTWLAEGET